jgi:hypothetical protein
MAPQLRSDLAQAGLLEGVGGFPHFIDTRGAAQFLGVSASFLNKARLTGGGPAYAKFGAHVRYTVPSLLAWAESHTRTSTSKGEAS